MCGKNHAPEQVWTEQWPGLGSVSPWCWRPLLQPGPHCRVWSQAPAAELAVASLLRHRHRTLSSKACLVPAAEAVERSRKRAYNLFEQAGAMRLQHTRQSGL